MQLAQTCKYLAFILTLCSVASTAMAADRPNILFILADDLGYADVGFNGAKDIVTPNLDQLARQGTTFTRAYAAHPFCGPSRAGLLTGRYPHHYGAPFNLPERSGLGIPLQEVFIAQVLKDSGYLTGALGKWHLGEAPQFHPNRRGFDEFYGFLGGGHEYFPASYAQTNKGSLGEEFTYIPEYQLPIQHNGKAVVETEYMTDALSREAVAFVKKAAAVKQPFFLYLAYNAPHTPLQAKAEDMAMFPDIKDSKRKTYAGMVYAVDRGVGRIVDALQQSGQLDNTLIVFTSDNGGKLTAGGNNHPLREGKGSIYEGGSRVPMLFHWPQKLPGNRRFEHPVLALDFYPSFAALAGARIPQGKVLDGKDILPYLSANKNPRANEPYYVLRHRHGFSDAAVHKDQWKAVKVSATRWKLFDIENDISESHDLSSENAALLADLVRRMEMWSWSNTQPLWFSATAEGAHWRLQGMPRDDLTYDLGGNQHPQ
ncbi:MAG: sulfatase-like hydrolase/transferase [Gammaproteobacteria bacterium]|nr:sulfatase-like hydrolase/transferase [Gammaproteobacteria bacterium]